MIYLIFKLLIELRIQTDIFGINVNFTHFNFFIQSFKNFE